MSSGSMCRTLCWFNSVEDLNFFGHSGHRKGNSPTRKLEFFVLQNNWKNSTSVIVQVPFQACLGGKASFAVGLVTFERLFTFMHLKVTVKDIFWVEQTNLGNMPFLHSWLLKDLSTHFTDGISAHLAAVKLKCGLTFEKMPHVLR